MQQNTSAVTGGGVDSNARSKLLTLCNPSPPVNAEAIIAQGNRICILHAHHANDCIVLIDHV